MIKADESALQQSIHEYLEWEGFIVFTFASPGTHRQLRGSVPDNWPDILAIRGGEHCYLECKVPGRKATLKQEALHTRLKDAGCRVAVVHSVEEVQEALRVAGFELRGELQ